MQLYLDKLFGRCKNNPYFSRGEGGGLFWLILVLFLVKNGKMSSVARVSKEEKERNIICQHGRLLYQPVPNELQILFSILDSWFEFTLWTKTNVNPLPPIKNESMYFHLILNDYRISANSCRNNYSFLETLVRQLFKGGNN